MYACWTVKGGSGCTVFASAFALALAKQQGKACVVDFGGDVPSVLGMAEPAGRGIRDWLAIPHRTPHTYLDLMLRATSELSVIPAGTASSFGEDAFRELVEAADSNTVLDFGTLQPPESICDALRSDWLIIRPCYLALRRAARLLRKPRGVVVVREAGRSLTSRDIESVVGAPVIAQISVSEGVARSVDAGLLATRLPKQLATELEALL
ncbi:MAG: hypothetical protein RL072_1796 [Actinomycetota bacterium]|jgi:Mrp family chromosome partitioning ATPase